MKKVHHLRNLSNLTTVRSSKTYLSTYEKFLLFSFSVGTYPSKNFTYYLYCRQSVLPNGSVKFYREAKGQEREAVYLSAGTQEDV